MTAHSMCTALLPAAVAPFLLLLLAAQMLHAAAGLAAGDADTDTEARGRVRFLPTSPRHSTGTADSLPQATPVPYKKHDLKWLARLAFSCLTASYAR